MHMRSRKPKVDCILWQKSCHKKTGYGQCWDPAKKRVRKAHRMSWERAYGRIPKGKFVLHTCDCPPCVNPRHLYIGTQKDNMRDRKVRGRDPEIRGEKNPNCKISDADVWRLRQLYKTELTQKDLAGIFDLSQPYVSKILRGVNRAC